MSAIISPQIADWTMSLTALDSLFDDNEIAGYTPWFYPQFNTESSLSSVIPGTPRPLEFETGEEDVSGVVESGESAINGYYPYDCPPFYGLESMDASSLASRSWMWPEFPEATGYCGPSSTSLRTGSPLVTDSPHLLNVPHQPLTHCGTPSLSPPATSQPSHIKVKSISPRYRPILPAPPGTSRGEHVDVSVLKKYMRSTNLSQNNRSTDTPEFERIASAYRRIIPAPNTASQNDQPPAFSITPKKPLSKPPSTDPIVRLPPPRSPLAIRRKSTKQHTRQKPYDRPPHQTSPTFTPQTYTTLTLYPHTSPTPPYCAMQPEINVLSEETPIYPPEPITPALTFPLYMPTRLEDVHASTHTDSPNSTYNKGHTTSEKEPLEQFCVASQNCATSQGNLTVPQPVLSTGNTTASTHEIPTSDAHWHANDTQVSWQETPLEGRRCLYDNCGKIITNGDNSWWRAHIYKHTSNSPIGFCLWAGCEGYSGRGCDGRYNDLVAHTINVHVKSAIPEYVKDVSEIAFPPEPAKVPKRKRRAKKSNTN